MYSSNRDDPVFASLGGSKVSEYDISILNDEPAMTLTTTKGSPPLVIHIDFTHISLATISPAPVIKKRLFGRKSPVQPSDRLPTLRLNILRCKVGSHDYGEGSISIKAKLPLLHCITRITSALSLTAVQEDESHIILLMRSILVEEGLIRGVVSPPQSLVPSELRQQSYVPSKVPFSQKARHDAQIQHDQDLDDALARLSDLGAPPSACMASSGDVPSLPDMPSSIPDLEEDAQTILDEAMDAQRISEKHHEKGEEPSSSSEDGEDKKEDAADEGPSSGTSLSGFPSVGELSSQGGDHVQLFSPNPFMVAHSSATALEISPEGDTALVLTHECRAYLCPITFEQCSVLTSGVPVPLPAMPTAAATGTLGSWFIGMANGSITRVEAVLQHLKRGEDGEFIDSRLRPSTFDSKFLLREVLRLGSPRRAHPGGVNDLLTVGRRHLLSCGMDGRVLLHQYGPAPAPHDMVAQMLLGGCRPSRLLLLHAETPSIAICMVLLHDNGVRIIRCDTTNHSLQLLAAGTLPGVDKSADREAVSVLDTAWRAGSPLPKGRIRLLLGRGPVFSGWDLHLSSICRAGKKEGELEFHSAGHIKVPEARSVNTTCPELFREDPLTVDDRCPVAVFGTTGGDLLTSHVNRVHSALAAGATGASMAPGHRRVSLGYTAMDVRPSPLGEYVAVRLGAPSCRVVTLLYEPDEADGY
eukprot:gnl/Dysnectes_brevis/5690_a8325_323.p1 GENE.gnl/Dysnectes_brevis/5690_a8325_323~~gnl/Dysnectes_brevis/5690_a8325_323.p1  ORF type:complete len:698 (-),score=197.16 gnl/Dysnectes_brevis/5690_a8325_323:31-2124(-)